MKGARVMDVRIANAPVMACGRAILRAMAGRATFRAARRNIALMGVFVGYMSGV